MREGEAIMTMQSFTAPWSAPVHVPTLRSVFRRIINSVIEGRERKAAEQIAQYLRERKDLRDAYRVELERRSMGQ
jgi:hypothetical protein